MTVKRDKIEGLVATIVVHALVLLLLFLIVVTAQPREEESGVPVLLGNTEFAQGDDYTLTPIDLTNQQVTPQAPEAASGPAPAKEEPVVTQEEEETVKMPEAKKAQKKKQAAEKSKQEREEQNKKKEAERAARTANDKISGAFGRSSRLSSSGKAEGGTGTQGTPGGNSREGKLTGTGGYGSFDLGGRSLGGDGLPRPVYRVQEEGRVVVTITVNPAGRVIAASINLGRTNTSSPQLRQAALDAARRAQFNSVDLVDNQTGTIVYYFKLK